MQEINDKLLCTMTRVIGGENLRTSVVTGVATDSPKKNSCFTLLAAPINEGSIGRMVVTSRVQQVLPTENPSTVFIVTENSTYRLTFEEKGEEEELYAN